MPLVIALEPDVRQATVLKRVIRERANADVAVVDTRDAALAAIAERMPDVILLTALLSPRDEEELFSRLRAMPGAEHVQTHTIPQLASAAAPQPEERGQGMFGKLRRKKAESQPIPGCDPDLFAQEVMTYLQRATELKARGVRLRPDIGAPEVRTAAPDEERQASRGDGELEPLTSSWASPFEWRPSSDSRGGAPARPQIVETLVSVPSGENGEERERRAREREREREESDRIRREAEAARREAEEERQRLMAEAEQQRAEAVAHRRRLDEEAERQRAEAEAVAAKEREAERLRVEAEREAERLRVEAAREKERLRVEAEREAERVRVEARRQKEAAEREAARLRAEAERQKQEADAAAARRREAERLRKEAEEEKARLRKIAEEEKARLQAEAERKRQEAQREAERLRLEAERQAERLKVQAEREAERLRVEAERQKKDAERHRQEAERQRLEAEREAERLRLEAERQKKNAERQKLEAERQKLEAQREAERVRLEAERVRESAQRDAERLRAEAEEEAARARAEDGVAAARTQEEARERREAEKARKRSADRARKHREAVSDAFAEFRDDVVEPPRGTVRLVPLSVWARVETPKAGAPATTRDELRELMKGLAIPTHVAGVTYPRGCRIRRVRIAASAEKKTKGTKNPVILSKRALEEARSGGQPVT